MDSERIFMFNALWFKPDGGREKYREYFQAAGPILKKYGGRPITPRLAPERAVIGEFDADMVFIVEYPDWNSFVRFTNDPEYKENVFPLREAAVEKSLLIRCRPTE